MLCEQCGKREAEVHLARMSDARVAARHLCRLCARNGLQAWEEDMARSAHASLPDGAVLDEVLDRVERGGTPDQRRQVARMLRVRAVREPGRLTLRATAFLAWFDALPENERPLPLDE